MTIGCQNKKEKEAGSEREEEAMGKCTQEAKGPGQSYPRPGQPQPCCAGKGSLSIAPAPTFLQTGARTTKTPSLSKKKPTHG